MKKLLALTTFVVAAAMFTACGDDSSSSSKMASCEFKVKNTTVCVDGDREGASNKEIQDFCEFAAAMYDAEKTASVGSGCPAKADLSCKDEDGDMTYYYGEDAKKSDCDKIDGELIFGGLFDDLLNEDDDEEDEEE